MAGATFFGCFALALILSFAGNAELISSDGEFDVQQHLGTSSRYGTGRKVDFYQNPSALPIGCIPIHLNLVARHGTRAPTIKRIKELDKLSVRLETLLKSAGQMTGDGHDLQEIPSWLRGWRSPWEGRKTGGELTREGEEELYSLGKRIRERFPDIFTEDYHPDVYVITATQVPRTSASAVAFGMGLFSGKGTLGPGQHRAFAVTSDSRANDIHLRFHDTCQTYKDFKKMRKPTIDALLDDVYGEVSTSLVERYKLNFTKEDVASLWFLCKQEAALLDKTDQACGLFSPYEVELLEWADDFELHHLKGYGESLNYRMGVPLLQNVVQSMEQAILTNTDSDPHIQGSIEKARLRFAHAETIIPFSCLLGLFLEASDVDKIQSEQPLQPPPKPPQQRRWRGSIVAPFAANNMLVLYKCPAKGGSSGNVISEGQNSYFVQILHNEEPTPIPGCNGTDFCPFEIFKENIVGPHLKHTFESLCTIKIVPKNCSLTCRLINIFNWIFSRKEADFQGWEDKAEL